jgi:AraC-like DNA-binding protein
VDAVHVPRPHHFEVRAASGTAVVDEWERHNAEQLIELAVRPQANTAFHGREMNLQLSQVSMARVWGTAHEVARETDLIAARPGEAIAVYVGLRGDALVQVAGHRQVVRPGQVMLCDVDRPLVRGFGHGLEELAVKVPRAAFSDLTGMGSVATPIVLDAGDDPYARALARLVGKAVSPTLPVPPDEQALLELVSVLATGARAGVPHAHRAAARAFIDDHLTDPSLSASDVADGAGISERHLSRVFADAGTSVPRQILARRLDLAWSLLTHGTAARTADVAARCGFTSMAYFSQAFKRRFGITAGQVRRSGELPAGPA